MAAKTFKYFFFKAFWAVEFTNFLRSQIGAFIERELFTGVEKFELWQFLGCVVNLVLVEA